ncbi:hypothetical protein PIB30_094423 [Stylosanthes scabra]|uniref:Uncharacterized protein n=1 Tax=Stylosanthes scabra TaxID=79078 RepID=A0ABU6SXW1_9FABA|nr:hypothetical protein [Stylosanthes scabra]
MGVHQIRLTEQRVYMSIDESTCKIASEENQEKKSKSRQLGAWMKAEQIGRRVAQGKKKAEASQQDMENKKEWREKMEEKLMEKLASLAVAEPEPRNGQEIPQQGFKPANTTPNSTSEYMEIICSTAKEIETAINKSEPSPKMIMQKETEKEKQESCTKDQQGKESTEAAKGEQEITAKEEEEGNMMIKETTNNANGEQSTTVRKWRRQAREGKNKKGNLTEDTINHSKRKNKETIDTEEGEEGQKLKKIATDQDGITAEAARQLC